MRKVAIIGFGAAGYNGAKGVRMTDPSAQIDVYTDAHTGPHNPMLTTYYIKKDIPYDAMFPYGTLEDAAEKLGLRVFQSRPVTRVDAAEKTIFTAGEESARYDSILIASGASAFIPDLEGAELPGVLAMRTEQDAAYLKELLDRGEVQSGLVYGASWSGIKVAESFVRRGVPCTLLNRSPRAFSKALYPQTAERVQNYLSGKGIDLVFGTTLERIQKGEDGRLYAMAGGGMRIGANVIVVTSGVRPNLDFLGSVSPTGNAGLAVDRRMQTAMAGIYAAGDCCAAPDLLNGAHTNIPLWLHSVEQGRVAGINMAGGDVCFGGNLPVSLGHCLGLDFLSVGEAGREEPSDQIYEYEAGPLYIRAARRDGRLRCVNMIGVAECSGAVKNAFIKSFESPDAKLSVQTVCLLKSQGIPDSFIRFLGGTSRD